MTYKASIENRIINTKIGNPIYISDLAEDLVIEHNITIKKASAAASVAVKRIIDSNSIPDLRCFQKGIYYRAKATLFGETGINKEKLIWNKYIAGNNGYETGLSLLHHMGLTTQIPYKRVIATNWATNCIREDKKLEVLICPPKTKVDEGNLSYLQTLDVIDTMLKAPVDADNPYQILADHINNNGLDYGELLSLADRYYNKRIILTLAHIAGERRKQ